MKFCPICAGALQNKEIDASQRLICSNQNCGYVYWNNPVPVVAALVEYQGAYIVARNVQWPKHIYSVISGYLEAGESPEQAVLREVNEELGLTGEIVQLIGNYAFTKKNQIMLAYEVTASGVITKNHELADIKLLSRDELINYDFGPLLITKNLLEDWKCINHLI